MPAVSAVTPVAAAVSIPVPIPIPVSVPITSNRPIPRSASVAIIATFPEAVAVAVSIPITVPVSIPVATPITVLLLFALPVSLLLPFPFLCSFLLAPFPSFLSFLLPPFVFLPFLFPPFFPCGPLRFPPLLVLLSPDLALELPLLLLNTLEFRPNALSLGPAGGGFSGVFQICLSTANTFLLGALVANFCAAQFADVSLDGVAVDQGADDFLCLLIHASAIQRAIDEGRGFTALEGQ